MNAGGSEEAPVPTNKQRLQQAFDQITQMCAQNLQLQAELADAQKGKGVDRGRQPQRGPRTDMFSVPQPPHYGGPPEHSPMGTWNQDRPPPLAGIKPTLLAVPAKFKGEHDDIDHFLGDCQMYFETF